MSTRDDHPEALIQHLALADVLAFLVARAAVREIPSSPPSEEAREVPTLPAPKEGERESERPTVRP